MVCVDAGGAPAQTKTTKRSLRTHRLLGGQACEQWSLVAVKSSFFRVAPIVGKSPPVGRTWRELTRTGPPATRRGVSTHASRTGFLAAHCRCDSIASVPVNSLLGTSVNRQKSCARGASSVGQGNSSRARR